MSITNNRFWIKQTAVVFALALPLGALAQTAAPTHHHGFLHRHPHLATAGAGVGAYELAKHSHHGIFHRHPVLTGLGAAAVAHHYAKKHRY